MKTPICGKNNVLPARLVGCGKPIDTWDEVYKFTHCDVPFHKDCANKHFEAGPLTDAQIDSMTPEEAAHAEAVLAKAHSA